MNEIRDHYLNDAPKLEGDLTTYFVNLWRHLDERAKREVKSDGAPLCDPRDTLKQERT